MISSITGLFAKQNAIKIILLYPITYIESEQMKNIDLNLVVN